ncbi:hypothetical protein [Sinomonas humi]|uniref:Uncharacterized protein n=1 Tax=Sinomonas humi TaxID=1338436 RepID=A0A0B2AER8_9MICC|nr:hypothetical protein [Sinomonas humi]KHL01740.1 hypothetical protein LK10_14770 [Sinomonas humi]
MAGNPSWGAGYHKGYDKGFGEGSVVGLIVGAGVSGAAVLATWGYPKVREALAARHMKRLEESTPVPSSDDAPDDDPNTE